MKTVLIYSSTHHENTKKLVDAIARENVIEIINAEEIHEKDLSGFDLIGFASGIFYSKFAEAVLSFARVNLPANKDVFLIATAGNPREANFNAIARIVEEKKCKECGRFQCKGFDTFGPFKIVGGIQKGHPDEKEIQEAVEFYKKLTDSYKSENVQAD